ncbi:MAG: hypothetical protein ACYTJ0_17725 [Planctomycetota bacterium]
MSNGNGFSTTAPPIRTSAPERAQENATFRMLTVIAISEGLAVSPAPCRHIEPTIIVPYSGSEYETKRTYWMQ